MHEGREEGIRIESESIRLDQFLKWAGLAMTGGEAKEMIAAGMVTVDGELEMRRGRKIRRGDLIEVQDGGRFRCR